MKQHFLTTATDKQSRIDKIVEISDSCFEQQLIVEGLLKPTEALEYKIDQHSKRVQTIPQVTINDPESEDDTQIVANRKKKQTSLSKRS